MNIVFHDTFMVFPGYCNECCCPKEPTAAPASWAVYGQRSYILLGTQVQAGIPRLRHGKKIHALVIACCYTELVALTRTVVHQV